MGDGGGPGGVAVAATDHEAAIGSATGCDFADVICGEVGGGAGRVASPAGAPVADDGAVLGDDLGAAAAGGELALAGLAAFAPGDLALAADTPRGDPATGPGVGAGVLMPPSLLPLATAAQ